MCHGFEDTLVPGTYPVMTDRCVTETRREQSTVRGGRCALLCVTLANDIHRDTLTYGDLATESRKRGIDDHEDAVQSNTKLQDKPEVAQSPPH